VENRERRRLRLAPHLLERELARGETPIVSLLAERHRNPFEVLISTLLSLRTKDEVTAAATKRLFSLAATPETMLRLSEIGRASCRERV